MAPRDTESNRDEPACDTCGRKLTLVGSLPKVGDGPRRRIYKCISCQKAVMIPPAE
jgi:DNA-directed RNA polymerase subunit RPC12/RpoP